MTINRGCRGALAKSVAPRLNFVYYSKISIKSNKPSSKPSKPTVSTYQAKQASFRCEKFQASKLRHSGLACLLNSKSDTNFQVLLCCRSIFIWKYTLARIERKNPSIQPLPSRFQYSLPNCRNIWTGIYGQRLHSHVSLISHPYGDSSAPYLGTAILTILCFQYLLDKNQFIS